MIFVLLLATLIRSRPERCENSTAYTVPVGPTISLQCDTVVPEAAPKYNSLLPGLICMLVGMVDVIFADVAQPDQARIVGHNATYFLKNGGHFVISIKANCIDSTAKASAVFASEIKKLTTMKFKCAEYVTLEPFERDHAVVVGMYRPSAKDLEESEKKKKASQKGEEKKRTKDSRC